jgi:hypothetical protein
MLMSDLAVALFAQFGLCYLKFGIVNPANAISYVVGVFRAVNLQLKR